jgi:hypothetical protein
MSTPTTHPPIPARDHPAIRGLTEAIEAASAVDGSDELTRLCNALLHQMTRYILAVSDVRGPRAAGITRASEAMLDARCPASPAPAVAEAGSCVDSALRVLTQDIALRGTEDTGVQTACDAIAWRLRDALALLRTGARA